MSSSTQLTMSTRFEELSWSQPHGSNVLNTYRRWKNLNLEPQPLVVFTPFYIVAFVWILSDKSALSKCCYLYSPVIKCRFLVYLEHIRALHS